jgi:hypothetical protein
MSHESDVATAVKHEFRRRGFRRFLVRVGLLLGLVLGGLGGAAVPTRSTYTDALHRQAGVEQYAADAILDKYTSLLSYLEGGKEAAFLRAEKVDPRIKELYRDHRRKAAELDAEAKALADGVRSLPASIVTHPGLATQAGIEGLGKPDLLHTQVYKQAGAGALAGGLLGWCLAALVTRRSGERTRPRS